MTPFFKQNKDTFLDCKYKFQSKYEAKIKLIRCFWKQVTFLRCYFKKWKVFSSKLWINVNKTWWKNHHNQGRFCLLYSREHFIVYQKEKKFKWGNETAIVKVVFSVGHAPSNWTRLLSEFLTHTSDVRHCVFNTQTLSIISIVHMEKSRPYTV